MQSWALFLVAALFSSHVACSSRPDFADIHRRDLWARGIVPGPANLAASYDFIIAGGGTAGMVLASRLSEDPNHTVLVLEAGDTGYAVSNSIDVPAHAFSNSLLGTSYDWNFKTVAQPHANNRVLTWARGKVLGGSSALNGMYLVRPSKIEYDTWANLTGSSEGVAWNWDNQFASMMKSETFTPPTSDVQSTANILYSPSSHGESGPLHASYPGFMLPVVNNWVPTLNNLGIPENPDPSGGEGWGTFQATSSINPQNWTRSHARAAYFDPLPPRSNLDILPLATVTRIIFDPNSPSGNLTATGVEFAMNRTGPRTTINVRKEVILAGGAIGSPNILMQSGVGPADVLTSAGVNVLLNLPGVGQNLQDHIASEVTYATTAMTAASYQNAGAANGVPPGVSSPFLSFINSATCYANLTDLLGTNATSFQQEVLSALETSASTLVPSTDPGVIAGYKAIYSANANTFLPSPLGHVELLLYATGDTGSTSQTITIQVALQHPFSHGRLYIGTNNTFDAPIIDPQYFSHFADVTLFRAGLKLARQIAQTAPLSQVLQNEIAPGSAVVADQDWDTYAANTCGTEFHPANTMAMLPLDQGGVVDAKLKVYGLANVRAVDGSVFPIQFAAHLQWPVYGLAEMGSTIIRDFYNGVPAPGDPTVSAAPSPSASSRTSSPNNGASSLSLAPGNAMFVIFALTIALLVGTF